MVQILGRFNRIAAMFDHAAARERTACNSSSGSDHYPEEETEDLWDLVESFINKEVEVLHEEVKDDKSDVDEKEEEEEEEEDVKERLRRILEYHGGGERRRIMDEVEIASEFVEEKRHLMAYLRNKGFDAGLCKSRWERFGKNTAGKYEYVDVNDVDKNRFIVETNLVGEFDIARPTKRYISILSKLPRVYVGPPEELKQVLRIMCYEIRRSMKQAGIHVPPWRRNGYMQAKWFGHYKRTSSEMVSYKVKGCDCGPRVGFKEFVKTSTFNGFDEERKLNSLRVGRLMLAFNGGVLGL
ncbi:unnamed protein product [Cochlearia groenlandica]